MTDEVANDDVTILGEYHHRQSGARLVLAMDSYGDFFVRWQPKGHTVFMGVTYAGNYQDAYNQFMQLKKGPPPVNKHTKRDWQQQDVYGWEDDLFEDNKDDIITKKHARTIVKSLSDEFNMVAPKLSWKKDKPPKDQPELHGEYCEEDHKIFIYLAKESTLLHEMAHAIDHCNNHNLWGSHNPSFVKTLVGLYAKHFNLCRDTLTRSARKNGLLGPKAVYKKPPHPKDFKIT